MPRMCVYRYAGYIWVRLGRAHQVRPFLLPSPHVKRKGKEGANDAYAFPAESRRVCDTFPSHRMFSLLGSIYAILPQPGSFLFAIYT